MEQATEREMIPNNSTVVEEIPDPSIPITEVLNKELELEQEAEHQLNSDWGDEDVRLEIVI